MVDNTIPRNEPGMAFFESASYGSPEEPRFGEGIAHTIDAEVTGTAAVTFPLYSVLNYNPTTKALTKAVVSAGASNANCIAAAPITLANGVTSRFPLYVDGHWSMDALDWDASFTTEQLKQFAFMGTGGRSEIKVSKKKFTNDAIDIPN